MMVDLRAFGEEGFEAKRWVNEACRAMHPQDSAEKHLSDVEMKLQLISEDIASALEEQSAASLLRVPRASRDVIRLRDDASSLRISVSSIISKLKQAEGSSADSVAAIAKVDAVKQRMEAAHRTLQDAAGLAQLSATVEEVFASGDLSRAAETIANMRRCLVVIGEVPEFANVKRQLEILEDRLEGLVQPRLSDALSQRKVEAAQDLRSILVTIGRYKSLEQQYTRISLKPLRRMWEKFDAGKGGAILSEKQIGDRRSSTMMVSSHETTVSFTDWLPQFYDEVLLVLEQEWKWCSIAFPEDYKSLVPKLLTETMSSVSTAFGLRIESTWMEIARMSSQSGDLIAREGRKRREHGSQLELLILLHNITRTFARNIQRLFVAVDPMDLVGTLRAIYLPYEGYKQRYGDLELSLLSTQIGGLAPRPALFRGKGSRGVELSETVRLMEASISGVIQCFEAAVERCLTFTGGSEAEALLRSLDDALLHYLSVLQDVLKSLRVICGADRVKPDATEVSNNNKESVMEGGRAKDDTTSGTPLLDMLSDEEEWAIVQGALQLLAVADSLRNRSAVFEAFLRSSLTRLISHLKLPKVLGDGGQFAASAVHIAVTKIITESTDGLMVSDIAILLLADAPDKARRLYDLLNQAGDSRFHALTHAPQKVGTFVEAVNELVYDVLIAKVRFKITDVALFPIWSADEEENVFDLPSFSAYASSYISSIGEYLLTLPQQLEPLVAESNGVNNDATDQSRDDAQIFATEWMFKVAEGATALFVEQLRGIQFLSDRGAKQLTADIDYFCKVLSALSMQVPLVLTTFQACISVSREKLLEIVRSESGSTHLDAPTVKLVCKMRRLSLDK